MIETTTDDIVNTSSVAGATLSDALESITVGPGGLAPADRAKLDGIQAGATANDTDAALRDRSTHTLTFDGVELVDGIYHARYTLASLPVDQVRADLMDAATSKRWDVMTGGVTLPGGISVGTTVDDQNRVTSVIANAQLAGVESMDFKAESGWVTLSLDQVRGIAAAVALHVHACYAAERAHHEAIAAASDAELFGYDINEGWPA